VSSTMRLPNLVNGSFDKADVSRALMWSVIVSLLSGGQSISAFNGRCTVLQIKIDIFSASNSIRAKEKLLKQRKTANAIVPHSATIATDVRQILSRRDLTSIEVVAGCGRVRCFGLTSPARRDVGIGICCGTCHPCPSRLSA